MNIYDLPASDSTAILVAELVAEGSAAPNAQRAPQTPQHTARPQHSWAGSASFWLARICLWYYFLAIAATVMIAMEQDTANFETLMFVQGLISLGMLGCLLFNFVGFVFGIIGLFLPSTKKSRTVLGVALNSLAPVTFMLLTAIVAMPRIAAASAAAQRQQSAGEVDNLAPNEVHNLVQNAFKSADQSGDTDSVPAELFPEERRKLRGLWIPVSGQREGNPMRPAELAQLSLIIEDEKMTLRQGSIDESGIYLVDPTQSPKTVDIIPPPYENDVPALGIYELNGDQLLLCIRKGGVRPTSLNTPTSAGMLLMKLERRASW